MCTFHCFFCCNTINLFYQPGTTVWCFHLFSYSIAAYSVKKAVSIFISVAFNSCIFDVFVPFFEVSEEIYSPDYIIENCTLLCWLSVPIVPFIGHSPITIYNIVKYFNLTAWWIIWPPTSSLHLSCSLFVVIGLITITIWFS